MASLVAELILRSDGLRGGQDYHNTMLLTGAKSLSYPSTESQQSNSNIIKSRRSSIKLTHKKCYIWQTAETETIWGGLGTVKHLHLTNPTQQLTVLYQPWYHRCLTPVRCQFSLCVFVFLLSSRYRNSQSCFYTTSKLWKLEEFEVKYVRAAYHYYYWQRVFIWSKSPQTKLHSWTLHSQLVLIRTSQARSYLGQHYNKAFISYNFIIWG